MSRWTVLWFTENLRLQVSLSAGRTGGGDPLSLTNAGIRAALGSLFTWKAGVLLAVILGSVLFTGRSANGCARWVRFMRC